MIPTNFDAHNICLDNSREEHASEYVFSDIRKAFLFLDKNKGQNTVYVYPGVYWIDDPDAQDTVGITVGYDKPYGMVVECEGLHLIGLGENPGDVVIAGNRGQSHGAAGNYTMFHFIGSNYIFENITIGNYCSTDFVYERDAAKNRARRTDAVTQAQIATLDGDRFYAKNCRFVGRLNLCPVIGGRRSLYESCHFEMTDDALNGNAVYLKCDFDFYGNRPAYETYHTGAVFLDCIFHSRIKKDCESGAQYFTKLSSPVAAIDCEYKTDGAIDIDWTKYPGKSLRCYDYGNRENGGELVIGRDSGATVSLEHKKALYAYRFVYKDQIYYNVYNLLRGDNGWDVLGMRHIVEAAERESGENYSRVPTFLKVVADISEIESGRTEAVVKGKDYYFGGAAAGSSVDWSISDADREFAQLQRNADGSCTVKGKNNSERLREVVVYARTETGLEGAASISVKPMLLAPPEFIEAPGVIRQSNELMLAYTLKLEGRADHSIINWYRCDSAEGGNPILTAVSRLDAPLVRYELSDGDNDCYILAEIMPKHVRSNRGSSVFAAYGKRIEDAPSKKRIVMDFRNFPTDMQTRIRPGFWTVDRAIPEGAENAGDGAAPWRYGETGNGSVGLGLYQNVQGARLMYTPKYDGYGDMRLKVNVDPAKVAGQGFGSAGQYMDWCIKFDTVTLTGLGLRVLRDPKASDAVDFVLIKYENGISSEISGRITASCYLTDCNIEIRAEKGKLYAEADTSTPQPPDKKEKGYSHSVRLSADVADNAFGGVMIYHTGTTGAGGWQNTTMLHRLEVEYM